MATENQGAVPSFASFTKKWHSEPYPFISPSRPELSASGKNAIVTGGGTGIGRAIAIAFAQAGAASVAILGRRADRLQSAAADIAAAATAAGHKGTRVLFEPADVSQGAILQAALRRIVSQFKGSGKIDIFVSNAGVLPSRGPAIGYDEAEFRRGLELNVMGAFNVIQTFVPLAAPGAKLFNISSGIAHMAYVEGMFPYAADKAAALKMFNYVAVENPDIHVVNIQPGVVDTEMNDPYPDVLGQDKVELPGHFAVWLASPEASFLKGKFVWVNWDAEELISRKQDIEGSMLLQTLLDGAPM